jgi:hypothetical protein
MTALQEQVWDALVSLDGETLLRTFTGYHGLSIFDEDFAEFLAGEGLMKPDVIGRGGEDEEDMPEEGDYVISDCGSLGDCTQVCVFCGSWADKAHSKLFDTEEDAGKAIKADMAEQNYYPNVWRENDHGNISRYEMDNV